MNIFIQKLERLMKDKGINNLAELSKQSGIPYTTLKGFYTRGTEKIYVSTLIKLVRFFGCTYDYLIDDTISVEHILFKNGITVKEYNYILHSNKLEDEKIKKFNEIYSNKSFLILYHKYNNLSEINQQKILELTAMYLKNQKEQKK